ncbi:MAG: 2-amino-4-hydroxy-6-hydroxymethyldihydropteridine diphosphokinase [Chromatiales bacterium]|nr:2-amino-4-hydroxy-6-hydroxymethyldihydropteridine diphosphokinase [Chromatiales bacterium]
MMTRYVIGIGSNIEPARHVPAVLEALAARFGTVRVSRIVHTRPVHMATERDFYNLAVLIETALDEAALKAVCNAIEIACGRNRADPDSATKDRPADLDILFTVDGAAGERARAMDEPYYRETVLDLLASTGDIGEGADLSYPVVRLRVGSDTLGEAPATIHRQTRTGDVGVVE